VTSYAVGGWFPLLGPFRQYSVLQTWYTGFVVDKWHSGERLANFVRASKRLRLTIIHAKDDYEIPYQNSEELFAVAANATTSTGMDLNLLNKMKARGTVHMGNGAFISTWKAGGNKIIREQIVAYGGELALDAVLPGI
jgi:abhydrolase domain-containing protein 12